MSNIVITPDVSWLNVLVGTLLPVLVALVTSRVANDAIKTWTLAVLSALGAIGVAFQQNQSLTLNTVLQMFIVTFVSAVGSHYLLLKPGGITGSQGVVQKSLVSGGIGPNAAGK